MQGELNRVDCLALRGGFGGRAVGGALGVSLFVPPVSPMGSTTAKGGMGDTALAPLQAVGLRRICGLVASGRRLTALALTMEGTTLQNSRATYQYLGRRALPCIAPYNMFAQQQDSYLARSSNLIMISVSRLRSTRRARGLQRRLFSSPCLYPTLIFVDPAKQNMGTFIPYLRKRGPTRKVR